MTNELARWQFATTSIYHFLFVPVTIGLAFLVAVLQTAWYRNDKPEYKRLTKFFGTLLLINVAVGVVTGLVQEFEFGMNWSAYAKFVGDVFGAPLAMEGLAAFFLESTFLGLWIFGWGRLPKYVTYTVRLSPNTEHGMYDLTNPATTRTKSTGFVLPSNNEWVKAAYYDPNHGGTDSYWAYPTDPFDPPHPTKLNPGTGEVLNASEQPLATYNPNDPNSKVDTPGSPPGAAPNWCPYQAGSSCEKIFPASMPEGLNLPKNYEGNVSTVGEAKDPSPWGTYDQGGDVVENLETLAPQPPGYNFLRNWRYYHGGVANAPAYQLEISAFGFNVGDPAIEPFYPWDGFRVGIVGNLE